jgi:hypothetical protein
MTTKNRKRSLSAFVALIGVLLMSSGFAVMATAGSASATDKKDEQCVEKPGTEPSYTDWEDKGDLIKTEENSPPGPDTDTVRYIFKGQTDPEIVEEAKPGKWWNFSPNDNNAPFVGPPAFPNDPRGTWQGPHTEGGPQQDQVGTYPNGNPDKGGNWFHREPGKDAVKDVDYLWQKQTRKFIPGTDPVVCPPDEPELCPPDSDFPQRPADGSEGPCNEEVNPPVLCPPDSDFPDRPADGSEGPCNEEVNPPELCPPDSQFPDRPADGSEGPCDEEVSPPGEEPPAAAPPVNNPPAKAPTPTKRAPASVAAPTTTSTTVAGPTIPSTVKAGLGEDVAELAATRTSQGLALVGAGALVMLAGGLGMVRRRGVVARI